MQKSEIEQMDKSGIEGIVDFVMTQTGTEFMTSVSDVCFSNVYWIEEIKYCFMHSLTEYATFQLKQKVVQKILILEYLFMNNV